MISNCGHDERWAYSGGAAGDQNGTEWQLIAWYSYPWNVMLRYPDLEVRHWMGNQARAAALNDCVGYDQGQRQTFWYNLADSDYDAAQITVKCEADCSSGVLAIAKAAGHHFDIPALKNIDQNGYTGNEEAILTAAGFEAYREYKYLSSDVYLDNGDILLNTVNHTAFNVSQGTKCDAGMQQVVSVESKKEEKGGVAVEKKTMRVIDVSYAQAHIDWDRVEKVVKAGTLDGVIIRCGYGSDIASQDDNWYAINVAEAEKRNIPYGLYLYSYANTQAKIESEIQHTIRLARNRQPVIGVYLDLEENANGFIAASAAEQFVKALNALHYKAGVYCGAYFYRSYMKGVHEKVDALWWIAGYGTNSGVPEYNYKPDPGFEYDGWQYTSVYRVDGINGGVDTSEWYTSWEEIGQAASDALGNAEIHYRAHCQTYGWLPSVKDGQICGTTGQSKRMEAIKVTPPEGVELEVTVHLQGIGDVTYAGVKKGRSSGTESSENDPIMGTVGECRRLEAITIKCTKNDTGKKLRYQAHVQGIGWQYPVNEGELAGTTGKSKRLEAIKIWFE